jgi:hypothetical protein
VAAGASGRGAEVCALADSVPAHQAGCCHPGRVTCHAKRTANSQKLCHIFPVATPRRRGRSACSQPALRTCGEWINWSCRRLATRPLSLRADRGDDDVSQQRQAKADRNDTADLREKLGRRGIVTSPMPVMRALVIPRGQPSSRAELYFLHGSLHATMRGRDAPRPMPAARCYRVPAYKIHVESMIRRIAAAYTCRGYFAGPSHQSNLYA